MGKYLGLPESFGRKKNDIFASILDRLHSKTQSWSTKTLSGAGKMVMIKSVLSSIPNYSMACFKLPVSICKKIQSILTRFWWDSKYGERKMAWVAWKKIATPKPIGGLGFRDIQTFNDALLAKMSWRILKNPNSLMSRILLVKYCNNTPFLACKAPSNASHGWRGICIGRDVLNLSLIKTIGNGAETRAFSDPWIPSTPHHKPIGPITHEQSNMLVSELMSHDKQGWDREKSAEVMPSYKELIMTVKISQEGGRDTYHWLNTKDGQYSTKSGYYALCEKDTTTPQSGESPYHMDWSRNVWSLKCSPKIHNFLWRIFNKALPVGEALARRGILQGSLCSRCGEEETLRHLLFDCDFAKGVWQLCQWRTPFSPRNISLEDDIVSTFTLTPLPPIGAGMGPLSPWILWNFWKARNHKIFQNRAFSQVETLTKAIRDANDWQGAQPLRTTESTGPRRTAQPTPPVPPDTATIHTDAAWDGSNQLAGLGIVLKDPLTGRSRSFSEVEEQVTSPLVGESLAIRTALKKAHQMGYSKLHLFSDSKECVEAINNKSGPREIYSTVFDICSLTRLFEAISISFISRSFNLDADCVAKSALREITLVNELIVA